MRDKVVLVTGAASGMGAATARVFAEDGDAIVRVVAEVAARFGGLDVLVNNAGITTLSAIDAPEYEECWTRAISVLLTSQQRMVRAALPHLRASSAPRIVNIASTEALGATRNNSAYAAAKSEVTGLTLAVELGRDTITVNCICPGPINTGMTARIAPEQKQKFARQRTALGRYGAPEEVARVVISLCMPGASYITGAVTPVDGGLMARNG